MRLRVIATSIAAVSLFALPAAAHAASTVTVTGTIKPAAKGLRVMALPTSGAAVITTVKSNGAFSLKVASAKVGKSGSAGGQQGGQSGQSGQQAGQAGSQGSSGGQSGGQQGQGGSPGGPSGGGQGGGSNPLQLLGSLLK